MNNLLIICEFYTFCNQNFYTLSENRIYNIQKVIKIISNYVLVNLF